MHFAPQLFIPKGTRDISFYTNAFGAEELFRFTNDDESVHVAEFSIDGAIFHVHEVMDKPALFAPEKHKGSTVIIGLFVPDVDAVMERALAAGAELVSPATSYDYGYRQGEVKDPFGHQWMIQKRI